MKSREASSSRSLSQTAERPAGFWRRLRRQQHEWAARRRSRFKHTPPDPFADFRERVTESLVADDVVLDVGCGRSSHFDALRRRLPGLAIYGLDADADEIARNPHVDRKIVADATRSLELPPESVTVVYSQMFLEHIRGAERFHAASFEVLRPGGRVFHLLPNALHPVFWVNRVLPHRVAQRLAELNSDDRPAEQVFPAYYDHCAPGSIRRLLERLGFVDIQIQSLGNYSYGSACYPLFWTFYAYERVTGAVGLRNLWPYLFVTARKPESASS